MANKKINDLTLAVGALLDTMQLETDIGGVTANRITLLQLKSYVHIDTAVETVTGDLVDNSDPANPVINQSALGAFAQTALKVKGASANALTIKPNETLSAARTLNIIINNADRTINIAGDVIAGGAITFAGAYAFTGTLTAATSVTFPTSGTLVNDAIATLSSLTSIGTITTGTWSATTIAANKGGTGVANNAASTWTISGNFGTTITVTGTTAVTFPTTGTLTTLATVVSTANIYTAPQSGTSTTLTDSGTIAVDMSTTNEFNIVLGGNRTLGVPTNPPTATARRTGTIDVRQDITGTRTLAYAWPYVFPGGVAPVLSTGKLVHDQLYYRVNNYATAAVTVTIAAPGVMTWTAHGLVSGQRIQLSTTGALPTGLVAATTYWVTVIDANTFNLSTSLANAQAATFITTTGSQSGVHTAVNFSITIANNLGLA